MSGQSTKGESKHNKQAASHRIAAVDRRTRRDVVSLSASRLGIYVGVPYHVKGLCSYPRLRCDMSLSVLELETTGNLYYGIKSGPSRGHLSEVQHITSRRAVY